MVGKAGFKAGLIGAAVMIVLALVNHFLLPAGNIALSLASCGFSTLLYIGIGMLAGFFLATPRTSGKGAGAGAVAGVIAGIASSAIGVTLVALGVSNSIDPQQLEQLAELGMNPTLVLIPGAVCGLVIGSGAAAAGGAILAAIRAD